MAHVISNTRHCKDFVDSGPAGSADEMPDAARGAETLIPSGSAFGEQATTTLKASASRSEAAVRRDGTTTLAEEYVKCGKDWQTELRQRAREVALARELRLDLSYL